METAIIERPETSTEVTVKKNASTLTKIKRAIRRFRNTNFSRYISDAVNSFVKSTWSLGNLAGRLCWVTGCYAILILFPLAMEIDRELTLAEVENRERERLMHPRR